MIRCCEWELQAMEGFNWEFIRTRHYECAVRAAAHLLHEPVASADDCLQALSARGLRPDGARILDLGCGVGAFLARLRESDGHVDWTATFGVTSVHPSDLEILQPPAGHPEFADRHLLRFDLETLAMRASDELRGVRFDLVTSHYCICHLKDPLAATCIAFELLRPGGVVFFIEPFNAATNMTPYTDHLRYHMRSEDDEVVPVGLRAHMLPLWVKRGAHVFSSVTTVPPHKHVLALRKPNSAGPCPGISLDLPPELHAEHSEVAGWPCPRVRDARIDDLRRPFVSPRSTSFQEWLSKT